jgi:type I restriction enzyme, S subunit
VLGGDKMSEWRKCKLGDLVFLEYGKSLENYQDSIGNYPVYGTNGKIGNTDSYLSPIPSIIIGRKGAYRGVHFSKSPFYAIDTAFYIKPKTQSIDLFYLYNFLLTQDINSMDSGSAIPSTDKYEIYDIDMFLPSLPEQRAIAEVLSSLDDKIDLLTRQNKTLEGMAEALWRKMFVEEVGSGWKRGKLGDIADLNPARSIKKGTIALYLDMSNMPTNGPFPMGWVQREFTNGMKFKNGDTIIARITPCLENGKTAYVNFLADNEIGWGSTEYIILTPKLGYEPEWFYFLAKNDDFRDYAIQNMTGTSGRQRVSGESIGQYEIVMPPIKRSEWFSEFAKPIMEHIKHNSFQIRILYRMRDKILPKLMNGEVKATV